MKKYLYLLVYMTLSLTFLVGCEGYDNTTPVKDIESPITKTEPSQPNEITDWEPTAYETVNNFEGVTMTVKKGTTFSTGLIVVFKNNSNSQCTYGDYFWLEKKINGSWYQVPVTIDSYGFNDIGYSLAPSGEGEWVANWNWLYGSLDTGKYRIIKDILDFRGTGDYDSYYLATEFTLDDKDVSKD